MNLKQVIGLKSLYKKELVYFIEICNVSCQLNKDISYPFDKVMKQIAIWISFKRINRILGKYIQD